MRAGLVCLVVIALMSPAPMALAQTREHTAFARAILSQLQPVSVDKDREYCGYIFRDDAGGLRATPAHKGRLDRCIPTLPDRGRVIASYHTHGAFTPRADSEIPSPEDLMADMAEGVDGWVATPGGRLWFNDHAAHTTRQVCGIGCLPSDPAFEPGLTGPIRTRYTLRDLFRRIQRLEG